MVEQLYSEFRALTGYLLASVESPVELRFLPIGAMESFSGGSDLVELESRLSVPP
jgi:hypothetical protein